MRGSRCLANTIGRMPSANRASVLGRSATACVGAPCDAARHGATGLLTLGGIVRRLFQVDPAT